MEDAEVHENGTLKQRSPSLFAKELYWRQISGESDWNFSSMSSIRADEVNHPQVARCDVDDLYVIFNLCLHPVPGNRIINIAL
jgi:hypothetical protein